MKTRQSRIPAIAVQALAGTRVLVTSLVSDVAWLLAVRALLPLGSPRRDDVSLIAVQAVTKTVLPVFFRDWTLSQPHEPCEELC